MAIVDAISNDDRLQIGAACADLPLVTAGSGIALGLPQNFRAQGLLQEHDAARDLPPTQGLRAIVCGSCSQATQAQLADAMARGTPAYAIDPLRLAANENQVAQRSEEHTSELQSLMRNSYAVFCLKKKNKQNNTP